MTSILTAGAAAALLWLFDDLLAADTVLLAWAAFAGVLFFAVATFLAVLDDIAYFRERKHE